MNFGGKLLVICLTDVGTVVEVFPIFDAQRTGVEHGDSYAVFFDKGGLDTLVVRVAKSEGDDSCVVEVPDGAFQPCTALIHSVVVGKGAMSYSG